MYVFFLFIYMKHQVLSVYSVRRRKTVTIHPERKASGRSERIMLRNKALVARKYYWEEIRRLRSDDVTVILAEQEFFVDERTIQNALLEYADFYTDLCHRKVGAAELQKQFPSFRF